MKTWIKLLTGAPLTVATLGFSCNPGEPPAVTYYECHRTYNAAWTSAPGFSLQHASPAPCPIDSSSGQLNGGGVVKESGVNFPSSGDAASLDVTIYNHYYYTTPPSALGELAGGTEWFAWSGAGTGDSWQAQVYRDFAPGPNPDAINFEVSLFTSLDKPMAWYLLEYFGPE